MYIVSDELEEEDCKVPNFKGWTRIIFWVLKKLLNYWGSEKHLKELADSIYVPLFLHLVKEFYNPKKKREITLSFSDIEKILGTDLPQKAKKSSAWWKKNTSVQARAFRFAGWKARYPNISSKKVTFERKCPLLGPLEPLAYKILLLNRYRMK